MLIKTKDINSNEFKDYLVVLNCDTHLGVDKQMQSTDMARSQENCLLVSSLLLANFITRLVT